MFVLLAIIVTVICIFWTWFQANAISISGLATALAFFATAWAAHEGRKSAKAAFKALKTSEDALEETRKNYLSDAFNQRFSLLLEQHNAYLEKVNNYVSTDSGWEFIKNIFNSSNHQEAFNSMSGHIILSPYMRILYHTLKFINEDYFGSKDDVAGRKKYTSLIRSLISNDVLFLIAVNSSFIYNNGIYNQYHRYQYFLQKFDFFEHADFFCIYHQKDMDKKEKIEKPFEQFGMAINVCFNRCINEGGCEPITQYNTAMRTPETIAYLYKNPHQHFVKIWFDSLPWFLLLEFIKKTEKRSYEEIFDLYFKDHYLNCYIDDKQPDYNLPYEKSRKIQLNPSILKSIVRAVRRGQLKVSDVESLRLVKLKNGSSYVLLHNRFETLYYRIAEYMNVIDRKNDILFVNGYKPVTLMYRKISAYENEVRRQRVEQ